MALKFMYNGIKADGNLHKGHFSFGELNTGKMCITFYVSDYKRLPKTVRDEFTVENNTDIMTDYFEDDRIRFFKGDKMWNEAVAAVIKERTKTLKRLESKGVDVTNLKAEIARVVAYA